MSTQIGKIDLVCFTGDAAQSGLATEYLDLNQHVESITRMFPEAAWLAVPGNHDLVRPSSGSESSNAAEALERYATEGIVRDRLWGKGSEGRRKAISPSFSNYIEWSESLFASHNSGIVDVRSGLLPGDRRWHFESRGIKIGFVGLNTAFLQLTDRKYDASLGFNEAQLSALGVGPEWFQEHDHTILLTHHSRKWLAKNDTREFDDCFSDSLSLHLCGHEHAQDFTFHSKGGGRPRRTFVGRSLCGLEKYGTDLDLDRLHGYSVIQIAHAEPGAQLRVFPREASRLAKGGWRFHPARDVICEPSGAMLFDGEAYAPLSLHRRPGGMEGTPKSRLPSDGVAPSGWIRVEFEENRRSSDSDLEFFFDGGQPTWRILSSLGCVPVREIVLQALKELSRTPRTMIQFVGPAGEGKSTALKQLAIAANREGWVVHFLDDSTAFGTTRYPEIEENEPTLLIIDEAHTCLDEILAAAKLHHSRGDSVAWAIAARSLDWFAATGAEPEFEQFLNVWPAQRDRKSAFTLTIKDAQMVSASWEKAGTLRALDSVRKENRAQFLVDLAKRQYVGAPPSFLGAILQARFSPEALRSHIRQAMRRLADVQVGDAGGTLFEAVFLACAAEVAGIDGVDLRVVSQHLAVPQSLRRVSILNRLGEEAMATGGSILRPRHPAIAVATIQLAEAGQLPADLESTLESLARVTAELGRDRLVRENHGETLHASTRMFANLKTAGVDVVRARSIAARFAETVADILPDLSVVAVSLSATLRSCGRALHADRRLIRRLPHYEQQSDWRFEGRGYLLEIGITMGYQGDFLGNLRWALRSLADDSKLILRRTDAAVCLTAIGECSMRRADADPEAVELVAAVACLLSNAAVDRRHIDDAVEFAEFARRGGYTTELPSDAAAALGHHSFRLEASQEGGTRLTFSSLLSQVESRSAWPPE